VIDFVQVVWIQTCLKKGVLFNKGFSWGFQSPFQGEGDWELGQKVLMV
jgi:hypothetical protein